MGPREELYYIKIDIKKWKNYTVLFCVPRLNATLKSCFETKNLASKSIKTDFQNVKKGCETPCFTPKSDCYHSPKQKRLEPICYSNQCHKKFQVIKLRNE